ncbi:MAG: cyclic nucleotide-binding/CBS domain-containing protein [Actinomycetota bacterium]
MIVQELIAGDVATCSPDTPIDEAARQMMDADTGSLVVIDDREIAGIVTERDVLRAVADRITTKTVPVARIMTPRPDSLEPDVDVKEVAMWMVAAGYRHLPVTEGGRLVGMVSIKDLVWALTEEEPVGGEEP